MNAASFEKSGYSLVIEDSELNTDEFLKKLQELYENKNKYISNMKKSTISNGINPIISLIKEYAKL